MANVLHGSARMTPLSSSRVPSVEREQPRPCRPLRPEREDGAQMAQPDHNGRRAHGGPKKPNSTVLTPAEEVIVLAFRQKTLLPLDDVRVA